MDLLVADLLSRSMCAERVGGRHPGARRRDGANRSVRLPQRHVEIAALDQRARQRGSRRRRDGDRDGILVIGGAAAHRKEQSLLQIDGGVDARANAGQAVGGGVVTRGAAAGRIEVRFARLASPIKMSATVNSGDERIVSWTFCEESARARRPRLRLKLALDCALGRCRPSGRSEHAAGRERRAIEIDGPGG